MTTENEIVDGMLLLGFNLHQIKAALEDGEWLGMVGISQLEAEEAHADAVARLAALRKQMH